MNTPIYYFVFQDSVIPIDGHMIIARAQGNVIVSYDTQSRGLVCYIDKKKRVESKEIRDVSVNEIRLDEGTLPIKFGDVLKVGANEYKLYESYEEAYSMIPKHNRRRYRRPKSAYALSNLLNFYCAPPWAWCFYILVFSCLLIKYLPNLSLTTPKHLEFMATIYNGNVITDFIKSFGVVWLSCLMHSFFQYMYFNRNTSRKTASTFAFLVVTLGLIYFMPSSVSKIKEYVEVRSEIWSESQHDTDKSIKIISKLMNDKSIIQKSFDDIIPMFSSVDRTILKKDFEESLQRIDSRIKQHLEVSKK